jgi:hypothetical protein
VQQGGEAMKKVFALMIADQVIEKSNRKGELIPKREGLKSSGKDAYICLFIGRFRITQDGLVVLNNDESESSREMEVQNDNIN